MSFFSKLSQFLNSPTPDLAVEHALQRIGELVDPRFRLVPGFARQLAGPVQHALGYCQELVASLPGPIDINDHAFAQDPMIHALFATAGDIAQMLGRSQAVRDFLQQAGNDESEYFYAMIAARRQEKKQYGLALRGELIENDVPQLILYFSGHTLLEPSCALAQTRQRLQTKALESLLLSFRTHVDVLRQERDGLRSAASLLRTHPMHPNGTLPGRQYPVQPRRLAELDARLRQSTESLMPEHLVGALAEFLQCPELALKLAPVSLHINRLGIISPAPNEDASIQTINFPELTARDRRLHLAMLARVNRNEALAAVDKVRDQQHRFMLI